LLIGDQAIYFRQQHAAKLRFWDLGEEWALLVNLPFVYALWLVRPEIVDAKTVADQLRALRDENLAKIDNVIAGEKEFDHDFCRRYYRENLRFDFGKKEKAGFGEFRRCCRDLRLLPDDDLGFEAWDLELTRRCA
jgi:chorismate dehydratase